MILKAEEIAARRINDKDPVWHQLRRADLNAKSSHDVARKSYAAAIREVAEPIAVELDELRAICEALIRADEWAMANLDSPRSARLNFGQVAVDARAILDKHKKP